MKRTFECNFCRTRIIEIGAGDPFAKDGIGVYWLSDGVAERRHCANTENHICLTCLAALKALPTPESPA